MFRYKLMSLLSISMLGMYSSLPANVRSVHYLKRELADMLNSKRIMERSAVSVGDTAVTFLLKEAKFLSNAGLSRVYTKPGGYSKALSDFTEVNTATNVIKLPTGRFPSGLYAQMMGHVGNRWLILREESVETGYSTLTIRVRQQLGKQSGLESLIDQVIIYTD